MRSKWRRPSQGRRTSGGETRCRNICCIPSSCPASDRGQLTSEGSAFSVATESNERPCTGYHSNTWAHMGALRCCMMRWVNQRETVVLCMNLDVEDVLWMTLVQMRARCGAKTEGKMLMTVLNIFKWFGELCVETTERIATCKRQLRLCIWKCHLMTWSISMGLMLGTLAVMNSNFSFFLFSLFSFLLFSFFLSKYPQQGAAF